MECECENTECIAMFLDLFNKALQNKTGNPQYKFNPAGFMVDENGANFNAIERVLGMNVATHTVTCQWHFMSCGKNHIKDINMNERETFKTLYQKICYTYTQHEYDKTVESLKVIYTQNGILVDVVGNKVVLHCACFLRVQSQWPELGGGRGCKY